MSLYFLSFSQTNFVLFLCFLYLLTVFSFALCFRKMSSIILKKVGTIGGTAEQVRTRIRHILSCVDKNIQFSVSEVRVRGSTASSRPPIYEAVLEEASSAEAIRKAFTRFTRKKDPVRCPPELKGVNMYNSVTLATRVRISILRVCELSAFRYDFDCYFMFFSLIYVFFL